MACPRATTATAAAGRSQRIRRPVRLQPSRRAPRPRRRRARRAPRPTWRRRRAPACTACIEHAGSTRSHGTGCACSGHAHRSCRGGSIAMNADGASATSSWLGFELAGQSYAVPLGDVREIVRPEAPTPVPGAPAGVLGIISLRGSIITVLDGCLRLDLDAGNAGPDQRLVVLQGEEENVAVRIDALRDVLDLDTAELMPPPPTPTV